VDELSCRELVELVTDYFEGRLPPATRERFDAHLRGCDGCQAYLDQMRQTMRILRSLPEESISDDARAKLLDAFREWKRG
jgi:anti-sigma factor RsiW